VWTCLSSEGQGRLGARRSLLPILVENLCTTHFLIVTPRRLNNLTLHSEDGTTKMTLISYTLLLLSVYFSKFDFNIIGIYLNVFWASHRPLTAYTL